MIEWRLHIVMAEKRLGTNVLAEKVGMAPESLSRLRTSRTYPRLSADTLDKLCLALECQPSDLIRYTKTLEE